jgi:hypothetical protein
MRHAGRDAEAPPLDKHLPHFVTLEAIRESGGRCFLCVLEEREVREYFEHILYESVNDGILRARLVQSRGWCPRHAHQLLKRGKPFGTAILYSDQMEIFDRDLSLACAGRRVAPPRRGSLMDPSRSCPACQLQLGARRRHMESFALGMRETDMSSAFLERGMVCVPHFYPLLKALTSKSDRRWLAAHLRPRHRVIFEDLQEYRRKMDYRNAGEPLAEDEGQAAARAVEIMTGADGVF